MYSKLTKTMVSFTCMLSDAYNITYAYILLPDYHNVFEWNKIFCLYQCDSHAWTTRTMTTILIPCTVATQINMLGTIYHGS